MSNATHKAYDVTFFFRYAELHRRVRATTTAEAIHKAGRQVHVLNLPYEAVIARFAGYCE